MLSISELFEKVLYKTTDDIYVQCPAKVENVNGNYVDVTLYINDDEPDFIIYHVPIKRTESQRAYIFLGIKKGDRGVCRFFDRSTEAYLQSDFDYNSDDRQHDINDRCFELGFVPDAEAFIYPENVEIEIGLKDQSAKISFVSGSITINTTNANINAENISSTGNWSHAGNISLDGNLDVTGESNLQGNTTIQEKSFLSHAHFNGDQGSPTGGVI